MTNKSEVKRTVTTEKTDLLNELLREISQLSRSEREALLAEWKAQHK